ncbi:Hint domain-containing protein [Methylobacterium sp. DB0501]|uniref:Hint domain-containing protein n=1 Tax=Methylobacterium sp. DB0501 TaxID=2709665 RepID=UPI001FEE8017|nr:Hint domain-containing protein [Methylobacterium sp. DB0501]
MATVNVGFSFRDAGGTSDFANGTFTLDDQSGVVSGMSGMIGGVFIQGLSTYRDASNTLQKETTFGVAGGAYYYHWSADYRGVSFTAGSLQYNLNGSGGTGFGRSGQLGDTLYASDGSSRKVDFFTDTGFQSGNLVPVVCFTTGTRIRTARGEIAVEALRVGDEAVTASGALRPVTWIGHRDLDGASRTLPGDQQPVRIRAGAFGPGLPARDLRLSPGHPVLVGADADGEGGDLVPVMCLVNGTSIAREPVSSVTYWHVELDSHDILLAEGLPAESYLDWGDRPFFTEGSDHALHNPDFVVPGLAARCRPVAVDGPVVEAERARLSAVFAASLGEACAWDEAGRFGWLAA